MTALLLKRLRPGNDQAVLLRGDGNFPAHCLLGERSSGNGGL